MLKQLTIVEWNDGEVTVHSLHPDFIARCITDNNNVKACYCIEPKKLPEMIAFGAKFMKERLYEKRGQIADSVGTCE